jgi:crotonobetainyl-CoA:carnitine CoA-transferase CaiB-like acyl-CoA transferase|tara:strand:+ start:12793 stop:13146 length:354 start_codon:yes stop_codon:yes gene_type:complete
MQRLDDSDVTYVPIATMTEVIDDEQLIANEVLIKTGDLHGDYDWTINSPISIREEPKRPPSRAPDIGQDSSDILRDIGLRDSEIEALISDEVVIQSAQDTSRKGLGAARGRHMPCTL